MRTSQARRLLPSLRRLLARVCLLRITACTSDEERRWCALAVDTLVELIQDAEQLDAPSTRGGRRRRQDTLSVASRMTAHADTLASEHQ